MNIKDEDLEDIIRDAWWAGYRNGEGQQWAGHNAGYQNQDCQSYVERALKELKNESKPKA